MKLDTKQLQAIMPVSMGTIMRYPEDPKFPKVDKVGRNSYFDEWAIYQWLNTRSKPQGRVKHGDKLLNIDGVCKLLNRSKAWVWLTITKPNKLTTVDLSPTGLSKNPRIYMIERELLESAEFKLMIELAAA